MRGVGKSARIEFFLDPNVRSGADDGRAWQPQVAALADEFAVVAWDWRGLTRLGANPWNDGRYWARTSDLQLVELALSQLS